MSTGTIAYQTIPDPPATPSAGAVLGRLADGIGFRFRWATEGMRGEDLAFRPADDCMTLGELLAHIVELLSWVAESVGIAPRWDMKDSTDFDAVRGRVLELAAQLGTRFKAMSDMEVNGCTITPSRGDTQPVWNIVNGPLSDSLTHIGQILSWRRIAGSPAAQADVFRGRPPKGSQ
jgi:hypothetical protein